MFVLTFYLVKINPQVRFLPKEFNHIVLLNLHTYFEIRHVTSTAVWGPNVLIGDVNQGERPSIQRYSNDQHVFGGTL